MWIGRDTTIFLRNPDFTSRTSVQTPFVIHLNPVPIASALLESYRLAWEFAESTVLRMQVQVSSEGGVAPIDVPCWAPVKTRC